MVQAMDPIAAGYDFVDQLSADLTASNAEAIASAEVGGTDVIDSIASGPGTLLCPGGTKAWVASARAAGRSLVVVTPMGSRLPKHLWQSYLERNGISESATTESPPVTPELLPLDTFDDLIDGVGVRPLDSWTPDCPDVIEIARH